MRLLEFPWLLVLVVMIYESFANKAVTITFVSFSSVLKLELIQSNLSLSARIHSVVQSRKNYMVVLFLSSPVTFITFYQIVHPNKSNSVITALLAFGNGTLFFSVNYTLATGYFTVPS